MKKRLGLGAALVAVSGSSFAALPAEAQAAMDELGTFATDMVAAAWVIVPIVVVGFIGIKLFKKGANKAT